jgi:hypothetical protein
MLNALIAWSLAHGLSKFTVTITVFFIAVMLGTGILLCLGIAATSRGIDWYLERKRLGQRSRSSRRGTLDELTNIMHSLDDSVKQLREASQIIKTQTQILSRISQNTG